MTTKEYEAINGVPEPTYMGETANKGILIPHPIPEGEGCASLKCGRTEVLISYTLLHALAMGFHPDSQSVHWKALCDLHQALCSITCEAGRAHQERTAKPAQLIYLAAPYTHPDEGIIAWRVHHINRAAAAIFERGIFVFSPISHTHPIKEASKTLTGPFAFWEEYDYRMIDACDEVWVLQLEGWDKSVGVRAESDYANGQGKLVRYFTYEEIIHPTNGPKTQPPMAAGAQQ